MAEIPIDQITTAGDDATEVIRLRIDGIDNHDWFVDHKSILHDYLRKKSGNPIPVNDVHRRSVCQ